MPGSMTPEKFLFTRHFHVNLNVAFQYPQTVGLLDVHNFEAQSLSGLLPACLRLALPIAGDHPRLGIGDMAFILPSRVYTC